MCDEELDALFQKQATQVDFNERQQTMYEITKHIFDQVYWIGVWQDPDLFGFSEPDAECEDFRRDTILQCLRMGYRHNRIAQAASVQAYTPARCSL